MIGRNWLPRAMLAPKRRVPRSWCSTSERMSFKFRSSFPTTWAKDSTNSPAQVRDREGFR